MKAMILAAGEGRRMLPLTLETPKPLLQVNHRSLLEHQILKLERAGFSEVVINVAYLADKIIKEFECKTFSKLRVNFSKESEPLETGGGILKALPLLGEEPFLLINGDNWTDFDYRHLHDRRLKNGELGHLILVPNPAHNPHGDFALDDSDSVLPPDTDSIEAKWTFSGISLLSPRVISEYPDRKERFPLREALFYCIEQQKITAQVYKGQWEDIGTVERLNSLCRRVEAGL